MPRSYAQLKDRVDGLAEEMLSFPRSLTGTYSQKETDQIKAFVLLSHAEIEYFFEEVIEEVLDEAERRWTGGQRVTQVLSHVVCYWFHSRNREPIIISDEAVHAAMKALRAEINENHGIKTKNLLRLLLPVGLGLQHIDPTLMISFDQFGEDRGIMAHKSFKAKQQINPEDEEKRVKEVLLPEVSRLYQQIQNLRI